MTDEQNDNRSSDGTAAGRKDGLYGPKAGCDNCHGTGEWHDIVFDETRRCPCVCGAAMKAAPRTNDALPAGPAPRSERDALLAIKNQVARYRKHRNEASIVGMLAALAQWEGRPDQDLDKATSAPDFLARATEFMVDLQRRGRQVHASDIGPLASEMQRIFEEGGASPSDYATAFRQGAIAARKLVENSMADLWNEHAKRRLVALIDGIEIPDHRTDSENDK